MLDEVKGWLGEIERRYNECGPIGAHLERLLEQGLILQVGACGGRRDGGEVVCCVVYHLILNAHVPTLSVIVSHVDTG